MVNSYFIAHTKNVSNHITTLCKELVHSFFLSLSLFFLFFTLLTLSTGCLLSNMSTIMSHASDTQRHASHSSPSGDNVVALTILRGWFLLWVALGIYFVVSLTDLGASFNTLPLLLRILLGACVGFCLASLFGIVLFFAVDALTS
jgi:hypothetical protein